MAPPLCVLVSPKFKKPKRTWQQGFPKGKVAWQAGIQNWGEIAVGFPLFPYVLYHIRSVNCGSYPLKLGFFFLLRSFTYITTGFRPRGGQKRRSLEDGSNYMHLYIKFTHRGCGLL